MLSEAEYNKMMKAKRNADYLAMLDKSMAEQNLVALFQRIFQNWRYWSKMDIVFTPTSRTVY